MENKQIEQQGAALETVIIFSEHMEALASFYQEALGIGPYEHSPAHMGCQLGNVYFGFDQVEKVEGEAPAGITLWFTVDDLQATFEQLVSMGVKVIYAPTEKPWGAVLAAVYDPDGNILGLAQRRT